MEIIDFEVIFCSIGNPKMKFYVKITFFQTKIDTDFKGSEHVKFFELILSEIIQ